MEYISGADETCSYGLSVVYMALTKKAIFLPEEYSVAKDNIQDLVHQAHQIFNQISVFEVIDLDRETALSTLKEYHGKIID